MLKKSKGRKFRPPCAFLKYIVYCLLVFNQFVLYNQADDFIFQTKTACFVYAAPLVGKQAF